MSKNVEKVPQIVSTMPIPVGGFREYPVYSFQRSLPTCTVSWLYPDSWYLEEFKVWIKCRILSLCFVERELCRLYFHVENISMLSSSKEGDNIECISEIVCLIGPWHVQSISKSVSLCEFSTFFRNVLNNNFYLLGDMTIYIMQLDVIFCSVFHESI